MCVCVCCVCVCVCVCYCFTRLNFFIITQNRLTNSLETKVIFYIVAAANAVAGDIRPITRELEEEEEKE